VKPRVSMREALDDEKLLGSVLKADSRRGWRNAPDSSHRPRIRLTIR